MSARPPPSEPDALWTRVEQRLARERGPRAWLRSRATPLRAALAVGSLLLVGAAVVVLIPRPDLATDPDARLGWALAGAVLVAGVLASVLLLLRPLGRPAPRRALVAAVGALAFLAPAVLSLLGAGDRSETGGVLGPAAFCFGLGVVLALPLVVFLVLLGRRDRLESGHLLLLAAAGGLAGNLGLLLHCPRTGAAHLLLGHATVPLGLLALAGLAVLRRRSRERRRSSQGESPRTR